MALRFIDSFDAYVTADLSGKWSSVSGPTILSGAFPAGSARTGLAGLHCTNQNDAIRKDFDSQAQWIVGLACGFGTVPTASTFPIVQFADSGTVHCDVRFDPVGHLTFTRNGTVLATGTTIVDSDIYHYLEVRVIISDTVGLGEVKLNGVLEIGYYGGGSAGSPTGDTRNGANSTANMIFIANGTASTTMNLSVDDVYICDGTGSAPTNTFLGDIRVDAILPNGNGNSSQFDGSDGNSTDNYLLVDEVAADDDTTYVESPDVGDKDTYAYGNLVPTAGTIYGVQPNLWARKTDAGSRSICSVARLSGTEVDSSNHALAANYTYYLDVREAKPGGGVWTIADVNNAEFGQKVTV